LTPEAYFAQLLWKAAYPAVGPRQEDCIQEENGLLETIFLATPSLLTHHTAESFENVGRVHTQQYSCEVFSSLVAWLRRGRFLKANVDNARQITHKMTQ